MKKIITLIVIVIVVAIPLVAGYDMYRSNSFAASAGFSINKDMQDIPTEKIYKKITDFTTDDKSYEVDELYHIEGIFEGRDMNLHADFFNKAYNADHFQIARYEEEGEIVYTMMYQEVPGEISRDCPLLIDTLEVDKDSKYYVSDCDEMQVYIDENYDTLDQAVDFLKDEYSFVLE